jgi:hypothetical protein
VEIGDDESEDEGVAVDDADSSVLLLLLSSVDVGSASSDVATGVADVLAADPRIVLTSTLQRAMMP